MSLTDGDMATIWLTLRLATTVTILLLIFATPVAWWLATTKSWFKGPMSAIVALPLVLPPTVLGFYLLLAMGPNGAIGQFTQALGLGTLPFTFWGLVVASMVYSLPFVVQPIQNSIEAIGNRPLEAAATLGAGPIDRFFTVVLPLAKPGFMTATILGFAHTVGEFGIVLMIGGSIPGETRVVSVQIYDHVEALEYAQAHALSGVMIVFSFVVLLMLYTFQRKRKAVGMTYGR
ncbi:molybdate ABC transporter permease subunit [Paraglaciecola sp. MB-3u-78]|jgi:molybdate transport system permease protein|uniref:molybdate ABC transporter permease subunit n=1 Tax=Paraglaciecola sp. MB-3u-78 TaxID=2058332 RepID=UPI000C340078|nr:molybdate ABC transporter permease subunit [Paraglaciecola sp. MB-3u-78]PKG99288.1 molybdate ABC transporter permease subunit [Paraglaciecola sp. MB-3u-78]